MQQFIAAEALKLKAFDEYLEGSFAQRIWRDDLSDIESDSEWDDE